MKPYLSVVIPCLNEEHFLPFLLKNLNSQTYSDFEVIVVDGNSEDKTTKVTKEFKSKYPLYLYTTATRNVGFQRNLGAKKAKGTVIIFFDADTQIPKNYLQKIAQSFKTKHPHFLTTHLKVNSNKPIEKIYESLSNLIFELGKISRSGYAFGSMQAVKQSAFFDVGGYDIKTKFGEDGQLFNKLLKHNYKYLVLKTPRYIFSMRRFRTKDAFQQFTLQVKIIANLLLHGYHSQFSKKYQMGGKPYSSQK